ncbi:MAG: molybdopterin converting factor subunit 1 [Anaerolineae bacterium]
MATLRIYFFAMHREAVGAREMTLDVADGATVGDVWETLRERYPRLRTARPAAAVNQEYAEPDTVVHDGDEIAFIPPVSGGSS